MWISITEMREAWAWVPAIDPDHLDALELWQEPDAELRPLVEDAELRPARLRDQMEE